MEGRWSAWLACGMMGFLVGCTSTQKFPGTNPATALPAIPSQPAGRPSPAPSQLSPPLATNSTSQKTPAHPNTYCAMAKLQMQSAEVAGRDNNQREQIQDAARKFYQQALEVDPNHLEALKGMVHYYTVANDRERSQAFIQRALHAHPKDVGLRQELALMHARNKDFSTAIDLLKEATRLDPDNRAVRKSLGFCLVRSGQTDEGYSWLSRCMTEADARSNVANMLFQMRQDEGARAQAILALRVDPSNVSAKQLLDQLNEAVAAPQTPAVQQQTTGIQQAQYTPSSPQVTDTVPMLQPVPNGPAPVPSALTIRHGIAAQSTPRGNPQHVLLSGIEESITSETRPLMPTPTSTTPTATPVTTKGHSPVLGIRPLPN